MCFTAASTLWSWVSSSAKTCFSGSVGGQSELPDTSASPVPTSACEPDEFQIQAERAAEGFLIALGNGRVHELIFLVQIFAVEGVGGVEQGLLRTFGDEQTARVFELLAGPFDLVDELGGALGVFVDLVRQRRGSDGVLKRGGRVGVFHDNDGLRLLVSIDREFHGIGAGGDERRVIAAADAVVEDGPREVAGEALLAPDMRIAGGRGAEGDGDGRLVAEIPPDTVDAGMSGGVEVLD